MAPRSVEERFWAKVDEAADGCWLWQASKVDGYGQFAPSRQVRVRAHRYAYQQLIGSIPDGLDLDHLCRARACVNPFHLDPVPRRINLLRGETIVAAQARRTHCPREHEYTPENTIVSQGKRACRTCRPERARERYRLSRPDVKPTPAERTHCPAGHAYDEANTYVDRVDNRHCRACRREQARAFRERRKAAA